MFLQPDNADYCHAIFQFIHLSYLAQFIISCLHVSIPSYQFIIIATLSTCLVHFSLFLLPAHTMNCRFVSHFNNINFSLVNVPFAWKILWIPSPSSSTHTFAYLAPNKNINCQYLRRHVSVHQYIAFTCLFSLLPDDTIDCHAISQFIDKSPLATPTRSAAFDMPIMSSHLALPHLQQQQEGTFGSTHSLTAANPLAADQEGIPPSVSYQDVTGRLNTFPISPYS